MGDSIEFFAKHKVIPDVLKVAPANVLKVGRILIEVKDCLHCFFCILHR